MATSKEQKQYIGLGIVGVIFVAVVLKQFVFSGGPTPPSTPPPSAPAADTAAPAGGADAPAPVGGAAAKPAGAAAPAQQIDIDELLANVQSVDFQYALVKGRDPMIPLIGPRGGMSTSAQPSGGEASGSRSVSHAIAVARSMMLTGIMYDSANPLAVIDNQVVEVGHVFEENIVVESIEDNKVTLRVGETPIPKILEEQ